MKGETMTTMTETQERLGTDPRTGAQEMDQIELEILARAGGDPATDIVARLCARLEARTASARRAREAREAALCEMRAAAMAGEALRIEGELLREALAAERAAHGAAQAALAASEAGAEAEISDRDGIIRRLQAELGAAASGLTAARADLALPGIREAVRRARARIEAQRLARERATRDRRLARAAALAEAWRAAVEAGDIPADLAREIRHAAGADRIATVALARRGCRVVCQPGYHTTPSGQTVVSHPSAYRRAGGRTVYHHASHSCAVGAGWIRARLARMARRSCGAV
jgi:hypothetical protein